MRALVGMLSGAREANAIARALASEAVHETLALVARDHPLDYTQLVDKYARQVVDRCCAMATCQAGAQCTCTTRAGKPCSKRAAVDGACLAHLEARQERAEEQRRKQAYAAAVQRSGPADPYALQLRSKAKKRSVSMAFPNDVARSL